MAIGTLVLGRDVRLLPFLIVAAAALAAPASSGVPATSPGRRGARR
jgi:hypothetical protein